MGIVPGGACGNSVVELSLDSGNSAADAEKATDGLSRWGASKAVQESSQHISAADPLVSLGQSLQQPTQCFPCRDLLELKPYLAFCCLCLLLGFLFIMSAGVSA